MKRYVYTLLTTCMMIMQTFTGCTIEERPGGIEDKTNELSFTYTLPGSMEVQTYAVNALTHENRIYDLYVLFFNPSDGSKYAGCARSGVSTTTTSGSSRVSMPQGCDVMDAWELLFVANLEEYLLDSVTDPADWLDGELTGNDREHAKEVLMGMSSSAIKSPLLMSGKADKAAATNEISVELLRRVARIDVVNSATSTFTLVSAQVWNARTYAYLFPEGGIPDGTTANSFSDYKDNTATPTDGGIKGKLYAFPNTSIPVEGDINTTCLIIGGIYTGAGGSGAVTYYRVNVCASAAIQQTLNGNSIYTIDITKVSGDGEGSPGDAHNTDNLQITYSLNNWDDTYSILYVFDKYGNALGVSQRFINFSYQGPQDVDVKVFRIYSDSNPLGGDWTVDAPTGSYASSFTATRQDDTYLTIGVMDENTLVADRSATASIHWGSIEVPLVITQLSQSSQLEGIQATPSVLSFPLLDADPKEVCINLKGNYSGITRADIESAILYLDSSDTGWLNLLPGATADDPAMGLFYFNILPADYVGLGIREAEIKFVVRQGDRLSTTQVNVYQSPDSNIDGELRLIEVNMWEYDEDENDYINRGATTGINTKITGYPKNQNGANHLHFRMIKHQYIKYILTICSSVDWEIVVSGITAQALDFSQMSGTGDYTQYREVEVTVKADVQTGWDGVFYIQYEDGETTPLVVHQTGIVDSSLGDGVMYYYGLMRINNKLWLDRNLGASAPMDHDDPTVGYHNIFGGYNNLAGLGTQFSYDNSRNACPVGFRLPKYAADGSTGEWDYVRQNIRYTGHTATEDHPSHTYYLPYGSIDNPRYLYFSLAPSNNINLVTYHWIEDSNNTIGFAINSTNPNVTLSTSTSAYIRCVYDDTL